MSKETLKLKPLVKVWLGNIPYSWKIEDLESFIRKSIKWEEHFKMSGEIIMRDGASYLPKGCAVIEIHRHFKQEILKLHGLKVEERALKIKEFIEGRLTLKNTSCIINAQKQEDVLNA
jgi:hypothetical protein